MQSISILVVADIKRDYRRYVYNHHMVIITSSVAQRIVDEILSTYQEEEGKILAITIIDERGLGGRARGGRGGKDNVVLATKAKESFRKAFGLFYRQAGVQYGATLALAALAVANEIREYAGQAQSIITTYEKFKMLLLPMPAYDIVVGLVLDRSVNAAEEYSNKIGKKIERLLSSLAAANEEERGRRE